MDKIVIEYDWNSLDIMEYVAQYLLDYGLILEHDGECTDDGSDGWILREIEGEE